MFEPEYQNMTCPKCRRRKVYLDREIGYYCMFCGHDFSAKEMVVLIETTALTSRLIYNSGKSGEKPATEIKELPSRKTKAGQISREIIERKNQGKSS